MQGGRELLYLAPTAVIERRLRRAGNDVVSTDLGMDGIDVRSDIKHLPFPDRTFDAAICSHVLEHVLDDRSALAEMHRVLAPGGVALIMVPKDKDQPSTYEDESITSPERRREEFGQENHVRVYGRDLVDRLSRTGFDVSVETYASSLDGDAVERHGLRVDSQRMGRTKHEDIHRCKKPP